ncbi:MAG: YggT family protein [Firmicutes bacterium]|jgi:YggT family protein|nr:YggT family protein [Bacillota bacterium]
MLLIRATIGTFIRVINYLILIRVVISWVNMGGSRSNAFFDFIYQVTEPLLSPVRGALQRFGLGGTLDFSPIILMLLLSMVASMVGAVSVF